MSPAHRERCFLFIDGSNFYHQLRSAGVSPGGLDYARLASRLAHDRRWVETRFYVGQVDAAVGHLHARQAEFLARLRTHPRHQVILGMIQRFRETNPLAHDLRHYLAGLPVPIGRTVFATLIALATKHERVITYREKGVDVALACDMVRFAQADRFDVAFLLSNDGDLAPAVKLARIYGKRVFVAGHVVGPILREVCDNAIVLDRAWLRGCL